MEEVEEEDKEAAGHHRLLAAAAAAAWAALGVFIPLYLHAMEILETKTNTCTTYICMYDEWYNNNLYSCRMLQM